MSCCLRCRLKQIKTGTWSGNRSILPRGVRSLFAVEKANNRALCCGIVPIINAGNKPCTLVYCQSVTVVYAVCYRAGRFSVQFRTRNV